MRNGVVVAQFEKEFASYVGAKYAIACANGTVTLQAALVALGVRNGDVVAVPPLTMAATTIAVLNVGAVPQFVDVEETTWTMQDAHVVSECDATIPVSLYGLSCMFHGDRTVVDAAQTLVRHHQDVRFSPPAFTSYSFQASKILATGEGGMLVTNDEKLASLARSYLSLGYDLRADQPRIDPAAIKRPDYVRHVRTGINGRMNDVTAELGLERLERADALKAARQLAARFYAEAIHGCEWLTPQYVPDNWPHDYWTFAVACKSAEFARLVQGRMVEEGAEMPYGAWRLTYQEPAFAHLTSVRAGGAPTSCPVAEALQPRLLQFQTNRITSAAKNAAALKRVIRRLF